MEKYVPANDGEYVKFTEKFCDRCIYDKYKPPAEFGDCEIHTSFIAGESVDEWICDNDGAKCVKFEGFSEAEDAIHRQTPLFPYFREAGDEEMICNT